MCYDYQVRLLKLTRFSSFLFLSNKLTENKYRSDALRGLFKSQIFFYFFYLISFLKLLFSNPPTKGGGGGRAFKDKSFFIFQMEILLGVYPMWITKPVFLKQFLDFQLQKQRVHNISTIFLLCYMTAKFYFSLNKWITEYELWNRTNITKSYKW